ncbi:hypothetical protein J7K28_02835 [Candidatus Aerophobetes bacterium]|nr:hypothetical protein [Candidatus Aerophobetes bacterium]
MCKPLKGYICAKCCAENRGVSINCPPECPYFKQHEIYQEQKIANKNREKLINHYLKYLDKGQRRLAELMNLIESDIYRYYKDKLSATDEEVLNGLKFLRRKESPLTTIEIVGPSLGEYLYRDIEEFLEERRFSSSEVIEIIEEIIKFIESFKSENDPRAYLRFLRGYVKKMRGTEKEEKIIDTTSRLIIPAP